MNNIFHNVFMLFKLCSLLGFLMFPTKTKLISLNDSTFLSSEPPQIVERIHRRQQVKTGETIKLPCPVEANPEPLFEWTKDGESINAGWERYRKSTRGALRIKDAVAEDSGRYVCKATNGFGSVDVKYTVYVMRKFSLFFRCTV